MSLYYSCLPSISTLPFTQRLDTPPAYNAMISDIPCMAIPVMLSSRIPSFAIRTSPPLLSMVVPSQVLPLVRIHPVAIPCASSPFPIYNAVFCSLLRHTVHQVSCRRSKSITVSTCRTFININS